MTRVLLFLVAIALVPSATPAQQVLINGQPPGSQLPPPPPPPPGGMVQMPPRDTAQPRTGTARIRGRVFAADTGQPIRKAQVRAFSPELRESRGTSTDAEGRFELKELPAGRYTVSANKGSFVALSFGQLRPFEQGKPLEVGNGQTIEKVDFSLPRGAVVTGRVLDEFGEPIADVMVSPMRYQYMQGRRRLTPSGRGGMTNDIGEFRIFGLPPGQYYLSATIRGFMMMGESDDRSGYAPTYYPGTGSVAEAQRLTITIGQTLTDINMALVPTRTAKVSGTAVDSQGKPLSGAMVMLMPRAGSAFGFSTAGGGQTRPDGSFSLSSVPPGEYTLQASTGGGPFSDSAEYATASVTVAGDDVPDVRLVGARPVVATGRLIVPGAAQSSRASTFRLTTMSAEPDNMMGGMAGVKINDDFTFELKARPGRAFIRLAGPSSDWMLKAVRVHGVDATDLGIELKPNESLSDIEIELTNQIAEVSGVVTNTRGDPVKDYAVVVFPQDSDRWGYASRYFGQGRPDQDGRFKVRSLPAGQYYVIALESIEPGEAGDPEFLERIRSHAQRFSLGEGETKALDLKLASVP